MLEVVHFQRKPHSGFRSVENIFEAVRKALPPDQIQVRTHVLSHFSKGCRARVQSLLEARRNAGKLNHVTGDVTYIATGLPSSGTITTFLDLGVLQRLRGLQRTLVRQLWYAMPMRRSLALTVISASMASEFANEFPRLKKTFRVIYPCISDLFVHCPKIWPQHSPTVLMVGTTPNKNLERSFAALAGLACRLVILGRMHPHQHEAACRHRLQYINRSDLPLAEVATVYKEADLLLFPSLYEGFGMPIVEAQATGRPVVTSYSTACAEVADDAALLVDSYSKDAIRTAIERVLQDASLRAHLISNGLRRAKRFRAGTIAAEYFRLYQELQTTTPTFNQHPR